MKKNQKIPKEGDCNKMDWDETRGKENKQIVP